MKVALLSDPHITWDKPAGRLDNVEETTMGKMEFVLDYCAEEGLSLLIAGDLTSKPRSWIMLPKIINLFRRYGDGLEVYAVYGQHDAYMRESRDSTILGTLIGSKLIGFLGRVPRLLNDFNKLKVREYKVFVYGCSWEDRVPIPKVRDWAKNILVVHGRIGEGSSAEVSPEAFLKEYSGYDLILCGDIHKSFVFHNKDRHIVNTGPMFRGEVTSDMFSHNPHLLVWNAKADVIKRVSIPHKLSTEVLTRDHIEGAGEIDEVLRDLVSALKKGVQIRYKKTSETFMAYAKANGVEAVLRDIVYDLLREMEGMCND